MQVVTMVEAYSSMGLVMALYVASIVSPMLLMECFEYMYYFACLCGCCLCVVCELGVEIDS